MRAGLHTAARELGCRFLRVSQPYAPYRRFQAPADHTPAGLRAASPSGRLSTQGRSCSPLSSAQTAWAAFSRLHTAVQSDEQLAMLALQQRPAAPAALRHRSPAAAPFRASRRAPRPARRAAPQPPAAFFQTLFKRPSQGDSGSGGLAEKPLYKPSEMVNMGPFKVSPMGFGTWSWVRGVGAAWRGG